MSDELIQDLDDEDDELTCIDCNAHLVTDSSVDEPTWPDCGPICWYCLIRRYEEAVKPRPATKAAIDDITASLRKAKHLEKVGRKVFVAVYIEDRKAFLAEQGAE